ncbi:MAG: transposase [Candidatus Nanopelagicales bacterium]
MALSQSALLDLLDALNASDGVDVIRSAVQVMLQELIEAEATALIGAERHERTDARTVQRTVTARTLTTTAGDWTGDPEARPVVLPVPVERRRRSTRPFAVVMEASTGTGAQGRRPGALGADTGISKSEVSRICADLDAEVAAFAAAPGRDRVPVRVPRRYVARPASVAEGRQGSGSRPRRSWATGVSADGRREVLAPSATARTAFWTAFLRTEDPGLHGRAGDSTPTSA